jgi:serine/threonine protein phosphatase PrpC
MQQQHGAKRIREAAGSAAPAHPEWPSARASGAGPVPLAAPSRYGGVSLQIAKRAKSLDDDCRLPGLPLMHSGVSDLLDTASLEVHDVITAASEPRASDSSEDTQDSGPTADHLQKLYAMPPPSPTPTLRHRQGPLASIEGSPLVAHRGHPVPVSAAFAQPLPPPPPPLERASSEPSPSSPSVSFRSKGVALVHAALNSLAVGVHSDAASCGFMEDESSVTRHDEHSDGGGKVALFSVCDGHGGASASRFLQSNLHERVLQRLRERGCGSGDLRTHSAASSDSSRASASPVAAAYDDDDARRALSLGFEDCEKELLSVGCTAGSTAVTVMIQSGGQALNVAWVGDCRAVLCRDGAALDLSHDHTPSNPREAARVLAEGGTISNGRLDDCLEVTRAFGDARAAPAGADGSAAAGKEGEGGDSAAAADASPARRKVATGLSAQAECVSKALQSGDEFVILGSDGLWDVMSSDDAVRITSSELRAYDDAQMAAEKLVQVRLPPLTSTLDSPPSTFVLYPLPSTLYPLPSTPLDPHSYIPHSSRPDPSHRRRWH